MKDQKIICPNCGKLIEIVKKKKIIKDTIKSRHVCKECKDKYQENLIKRNKSKELREKNSKRMRENNPNFVDGKKKEEKPKMTKQEVAELNSKRMKENNPMWNEDVVNKMKETTKNRIESGDIIYKKGEEHHLYKGGCRIFSELCRSRLYIKWTKPIMERDNFTCTKCGKTKTYLNVHHLKPLREFIEEVKIKYNIYSFNDISKDKWEPYIDEIINNHRLIDGITVCKECHNEIDEYFNG